MSRVNCEHCGTSNSAPARFCRTCDAFLDWSAAGDDARPGEVPRAAEDPFPEPDVPAAGGGQPPAQPAAVAPVPAGGDTAPLPPVAGPPAAAPDAAAAGPARTCPECDTRNPARRRYCRRCGRWLLGAVPSAPAGPRIAWWRRLLGLDERVGATLTSRSAYRRSLSPAVRLARAAAALTTLALAAVLCGVTGLDPVGRGRDQLGHLRGSGRMALDPQQAVPVADRYGATPQGGPEYLVDDVRDRGWIAPWSAPAAAPCGQGRLSAPAATLAFPEPADVREVGIQSGVPVGEGQPAYLRPRTLELRWAGGGCQRVDLADGTGLQRFPVPRGSRTGLTVTIADAYRPQGEAAPFVAVGELVLWHR